MKRTTLGYALVSCLGAALAVQVSGCSILLGTAGVIVDNATAKPPRLVPADRVVYVKKGSDIVVSMADGRELTGELAGHKRLSAATYAPKYEAWRASAGAAFPALGESVEVVRVDGGRDSGTFAGFGFRSVLLGAGDRDVHEQAFADLASLRAGDRSVAADSLIAAALASRLPSRDALEVQVWKGATDAERRAGKGEVKRSSVTGPASTVIEIATDEVRSLSVTRPGHAAITGLLVGLTFDAAVLAIAASFSGPFDGGGCSGGGITPMWQRTAPDRGAWDSRTGRAAPRGAR